MNTLYMKYPKLTTLIEAMGYDNGVHTTPRTWVWPENANLESLELLSLRLPAYAVDDFVAGETQEVALLVARYQLQPLSEFLNEVFDGKYSAHFHFSHSS